ncbi:hypothetical protein [Pseudomonas monteilii]|uniref:hypothetical protein n=1 Tax=Pseudomonas monteilii TaxID=76759 RepID=UPI003F6DF48D
MQLYPQFSEPTAPSHYGKHLVFFPSRKNNCQLACNSLLESDYCIILEADPCVIRYINGLVPINLADEGLNADYTPDFLVETQEEMYYTEVKLDFATISTKVEEKLFVARKKFQKSGIALKFADERSIRNGYCFQNQKFLYMNSFNVSPDEHGLLLHEITTLHFPMTLGEILKTTVVSSRAYYKSMFEGVLTFDHDRKLELNTLVEKAEV